MAIHHKFERICASPGIASAANKTPSGNLNLQVIGYEVLTSSGGSAGQYSVNGIGQIIDDTGGSLSGHLTYTLVDVHLASQEEAPCPQLGSLRDYGAVDLHFV
jgi:hypothetical protein